MADFCKQCGTDMFGEENSNDMAGITEPEKWAEGLVAVVICEGCGPTGVDPAGNCVSAHCLKQHGKPICSLSSHEGG